MTLWSTLHDPRVLGFNLLDLVGILLFLVFTFGYHGAYYVYSSRHPLSTAKGKIHLYRRTFIKRSLDSGDHILVVQALRNLTMASTFMASSALIIIGIILNFTLSGTYRQVLEGVSEAALTLKLYAIIGVFAFSLWSFLLAIRLVSQLTIVIGADPDLIDHVEGIDAVTYFTELLNRASDRLTYGQRGFYFSTALIAWVYSSLAFVLITLGIGVFILGWLDFQRWKPPRALRRETRESI